MTRKKPYIVQLPANKAPATNLSVVETLLELDKLVKRYVQNHKRHPKLKPLSPFLTLTLTSGKEIRGVLREATEQSVAIYPQKVMATFVGGGEARGISINTPVVVKMSAVDVVEFSFPSFEVYPQNLT